MPAPPFAARRNVLLVVDHDASDLATVLRRTCHTAEVVSCRSADEAIVRLSSGRPFSAVLAGTGGPAADSDLLAAADRASTPMIVVGDRGVLGQVISAAAEPVRLVDQPPDTWLSHRPGAGHRGWLVAVCGTAGAGTSTVAAGLAARLAPAGWVGGDLLLADLALFADQAELHGLDRPAVGLLDLIRAFRHRREPMTGRRLRAHTVRIALAVGAFRLLPGLRRPGHWAAVSPAAFDPALSAVCSCFRLVVADVTAEFDGGSPDVEERNHMARRAVTWADMVIVIGRPGPNGRRRLVGTVHDLLDLGVDPAAIQPVVNRAVRSSTADGEGLPDLPAPVIELPELGPDHGAAAPAGLAEPLRLAVERRLSRRAADRPAARTPAPVLVTPGTLGTWTGDDAA